MTEIEASGAGELIERLALQPHPEGGHYRELYRASKTVIYEGAGRAAVTTIYYLLAGSQYSAWHQIDADEVWAFHSGDPLVLYVWDPAGVFSTFLLGDPRICSGAAFQVVVPAGCWFAAERAACSRLDLPVRAWVGHTLVGCIVAPGFEFSKFRLAGRDDLAAAVAAQGQWIYRLLAGAANA